MVNNEIIKNLLSPDPKKRIQAIITIKSFGVPKAIEYLIPLFSENNPEITNVVISTLVEIGPPATPFLITALKSKDETIRENVKKILISMPNKDSSMATEVLNLLKDSDGAIRACAIDILAGIKDWGSVEFIREFTKDVDNRVRISAARALGDFRDKLSVDLLLSLLTDSDDNVKITAAEALAKISDPRACDGLWELNNTDKNPEVRNAAFLSLKIIGANVIKPYESSLLSHDIKLQTKAELALTAFGKSVLLPLLEYSKHYNPAVRKLCAKILGNIGDTFATKRLIELTNDIETDVRISAIEALGKLKSESAIKHLISCLDNPNPAIADTSAKALTTHKTEIINLLPNLLADHDLSSQITLARLIGKIGDPDFVTMLAEHLDDPRMWLRRTICFALGETRNPVAAQYLIEKGLNDSETLVRTAAAKALGKLKMSANINALIKSLADQAESVQIAAMEALAEIGDSSAGVYLLGFLSSDSELLKITAIKTLAQIKDITAIPALKRIAKPWPFGRESTEVKAEAKMALKKLTYEAQFLKP